MTNIDKIVKIYDMDKNYLGSGHLLNMNSSIIRVKGSNLPILKSNTDIFIELYNEFTGISQYYCKVSIASAHQLNAFIKKIEPTIERRQSLKVRTDLSFYIEELYRNNKNVIEDFPNMKINMLNLSVGGMLISSNYDLEINDIIAFNFRYENSQIVILKSKVIRIDKILDSLTKELSAVNYGCMFEKMPTYDEAVITKYLFNRQLQLYKNR